MNPAPHWYVDPDNPEQERYWNGSAWVPGARVRSTDTPGFGGDTTTADQPPAEPLTDTQRLLELGRRQLDAQRVANELLGWILGLMVVGIAAGVIVAVIVAHH